ncbi:MAG: hypothetical protein OEW29_11355, partial [Acidimicrobiia bacterium]|nr:hypothetical protein [Acidimicrobiia bacterium]
MHEALQDPATGVHQPQGDSLVALDVARATEVRADLSTTSNDNQSRDNREETRCHEADPYGRH